VGFALGVEPVLEPGGHRTVGAPGQVRETLVVLGIDAAGLRPCGQHGVAGDPVAGFGFGDDGPLEPEAIGQGLLGAEPGCDPGAAQFVAEELAWRHRWRPVAVKCPIVAGGHATIPILPLA
jgi:hypothetical protein